MQSDSQINPVRAASHPQVGLTPHAPGQVGEGDAEGLAEGLGDGVGEGLGLGLAEGLGDGVGDGLGLAEGLGDGVEQISDPLHSNPAQQLQLFAHIPPPDTQVPAGSWQSPSGAQAPPPPQQSPSDPQGLPHPSLHEGEGDAEGVGVVLGLGLAEGLGDGVGVGLPWQTPLTHVALLSQQSVALTHLSAPFATQSHTEAVLEPEQQLEAILTIVSPDLLQQVEFPDNPP